MGPQFIVLSERPEKWGMDLAILGVVEYCTDLKCNMFEQLAGKQYH